MRHRWFWRCYQYKCNIKANINYVISQQSIALWMNKEVSERSSWVTWLHGYHGYLDISSSSSLSNYLTTTGNNIYGEDIRRTLLNNSINRTQYILMDRISPQITKNFIVRQESTSIRPADVIPELGIVGIFIR